MGHRERARRAPLQRKRPRTGTTKDTRRRTSSTRLARSGCWRTHSAYRLRKVAFSIPAAGSKWGSEVAARGPPLSPLHAQAMGSCRCREVGAGSWSPPAALSEQRRHTAGQALETIGMCVARGRRVGRGPPRRRPAARWLGGNENAKGVVAEQYLPDGGRQSAVPVLLRLHRCQPLFERHGGHGIRCVQGAARRGFAERARPGRASQPRTGSPPAWPRRDCCGALILSLSAAPRSLRRGPPLQWALPRAGNQAATRASSRTARRPGHGNPGK